MFLNQLMENEKKYFLDLVYYIANIDGTYSDSERKLYIQYCNEMNISYEPSAKKNDFDEVVLFLENSSIRVIRMVFIEIVGLILADHKLVEKESDFITRFTSKFSISETEYSMIKDNLERLNEIYLSFVTFIDA